VQTEAPKWNVPCAIDGPQTVGSVKLLSEVHKLFTMTCKAVQELRK
jgi:hypothetical protein